MAAAWNGTAALSTPPTSAAALSARPGLAEKVRTQRESPSLAPSLALPSSLRSSAVSLLRRRPLCASLAAGVSALLLTAATSRAGRLNAGPFAVLYRLPRAVGLDLPAGGTQRVPGPGSSFATAAMANVSLGTPALKTIYIPATGEHKATVVFMHGLGDTGEGWADVPSMLNLPNVKWVLPSAPIQPVTLNQGFPCPSWFDIFGLSSSHKEDTVGIDKAARYIAGILAEEKAAAPEGAKIIVGGFSQGGALSLHLTTRKFAGTFLDGSDASGVPLDGSICLSGWLPAADAAAGKPLKAAAAQHPLLLCHGEGDKVVLFSFGKKSAEALTALGFSALQFKSYKGLQHSACPEEFQDVRSWLSSVL